MVYKFLADFDGLVSASDLALSMRDTAANWCKLTTVRKIPGNLAFLLDDYILGELCVVEIRKLQNGLCSVEFSDVILIDGWSDYWKSLEEQTNISPMEVVAETQARISKISPELIRDKQAKIEDVKKVYLRELKEEGILPVTYHNEKRKSGRPRDPLNEWAYYQVRREGRDWRDVYLEWMERKTNSDLLANPIDSFKKAIKPR